MNRSLDLISGKFLDLDIPMDKRYLLKYFKGRKQEIFLCYYMLFGEIENFRDHTGVHCCVRWRYMMKEKYIKVVAIHTEAKRQLDLKKLAVIEKGDLEIWDWYNKK